MSWKQRKDKVLLMLVNEQETKERQSFINAYL
jgi:hypothetical protein